MLRAGFIGSVFTTALAVTVASGMFCSILHVSEHWPAETFKEIFHLNLLFSAVAIGGGLLLSLCALLRPFAGHAPIVTGPDSARKFAPEMLSDSAALFLIRPGVDEQLLERAAQQLKEIVGAENLALGIMAQGQSKSAISPTKGGTEHV